MDPLTPDPLPSPEDLHGIADRARSAAEAATAARTAQHQQEKAAAAATAAAQSAQSARAAAQAAMNAVGALPVSPAFAPPPVPAQPPAPPAPPPQEPPTGNRSGKGGKTSTVGWVGFALACVALVLCVLAIALGSGKASESLVTSLHASAQSAFDRLSGRVDRASSDSSTALAAANAAGKRLDIVEPAVKRAEDKSDQAIIIANAASTASARCSTCSNARKVADSPKRTTASKSTTSREQHSTKEQAVTPVVTMDESRREVRTDGRCVIELAEPGGAKVYVRLDTAKANGNLVAAKVDSKTGDWNRSNQLSYVGDGTQTVHLDDARSCKAAVQAFTSTRAFAWTSTRIGVNGCKPGSTV